jgi:hypothetical protein
MGPAPRRPTRRAVPLLLAALLATAAPGPAPAAEGGDPAPPAAPAGAPKRIADVLKGKLVSVQGRRIEIAYDFQDPIQASDWRPFHPFIRPPVAGGWRVDQKALRGDGNAGWRHRAVFDGEVGVRATVASEDAGNYGLFVLDDDRSQFDLFALADTFFSVLDRKAPHRHMLATFQPAGEGPGGSTEWREVQVGYDPKISGEPMEVRVRKRGTLNEFRFGAGGRLSGADRECTVGPRLVPGFYTLGARVVVTRVVVTGVLDAKWLREEGVEAPGETPADPEPLEGERKEPPPAGGNGKVAAAGDWQAPARRLADASLPREEREKALEALVATKEKRALRGLIDVMYREDDALGRDLAAKAFKGLSGKETGFRGEASKEARKAAMPRVWEAWFQAQDQIEKEGRRAKEKQP